MVYPSHDDGNKGLIIARKIKKELCIYSVSRVNFVFFEDFQYFAPPPPRSVARPGVDGTTLKLRLHQPSLDEEGWDEGKK